MRRATLSLDSIRQQSEGVSVANRASEASFVYLDTVAAVEAFTTSIAGVTELALDTEGASFHRFIDRIYLLQLSTRDKHAVIDPLPIGPPAGLGRLLEDPAVEVVFHDADYDLRLLKQDYGWKINHIFDTRIAAQLLGYTAFGLAALLERFFEVKLDKKHQRADWSMRPLTADMLEYAAYDTRYLLELKDRMSVELDRMGRLEWAREEFALLEGTRWADEEPGMGFLKLKGARDLSRRELAVLRELAPWRDSVAKSMDRATFRVLGNEQLFDIARTQPSTRGALGSRSGFRRTRECAQDRQRRSGEAARARSGRALLARSDGGGGASQSDNGGGRDGRGGAAPLAGGGVGRGVRDGIGAAQEDGGHKQGCRREGARARPGGARRGRVALQGVSQRTLGAWSPTRSINSINRGIR